MAVVPTKRGETVYLKLEDFTPPWRQAVVLRQTGKKLVLAVRVLAGEITDKTDSLSFFVAGGQNFILVEGDLDRVRSQCAATHRALEIEVALILQRSQELLDSDTLQFVTASDDLGEPQKCNLGVERNLLKQALDSDSEGFGDSEEDEPDEVIRLLNKAKKMKHEKASGSEKQKGAEDRRRTRYTLLDKKEKTNETPSGLDRIMETMKEDAMLGSQKLDINALLQMEILKELRGKQRRSKSSRSSRSDKSQSSDSNSSSSSSQTREKLKGAGKALKAFRRGKKEMRKHPLKHVKRYIKEVEENLGANRNTPYQLSDYSRRISWGKMKTLQRVHFAASEILQTVLKGRSELAALQLTQLLRATHQCCLDQGSWQTAWLLMDMVDPLERQKFGGEIQEIEVVASYVRAMQDLERRNKKQQTDGEEDRKNGKGKNGKGKKKEEATEWACVPMHQKGVSHRRPGGLLIYINAEINKCHGSFCRYLRIHNRSLVTGDYTPDSSVGHERSALFPSILPWQTPPGKFKHRRGLSKTVVDEAFTWMRSVWVLFNFLHAGSPSNTQGAIASVAQASQGTWTAKHEKYARTVFSRLLRYCAHPRGTMERGTSKLSELIERIHTSQYDPDINLDEALCGAKTVDPSRISPARERCHFGPSWSFDWFATEKNF